MNIIIPMAGAGQRFLDAGYKFSKPAIPTTDRRSGEKIPMVVCAARDLPKVEPDGGNITFIDRRFHREDGTEVAIKEHYPGSSFITADRLTEGQACTCLLAKGRIDNGESLLIAGCDNGMVMDETRFNEMTEKCDALVFTYRHNQAVLKNPNAYGWMIAEEDGKIRDVSIKKAISGNPLEDHAVVATFWFRKGCDFVQAAEKMIEKNDRVNKEFYVDQVIKHCLQMGMDARVFEIDRYIGWGTPEDYEEYEETMRYWKEFTDSVAFLPRNGIAE